MVEGGLVGEKVEWEENMWNGKSRRKRNRRRRSRWRNGSMNRMRGKMR